MYYPSQRSAWQAPRWFGVTEQSVQFQQNCSKIEVLGLRAVDAEQALFGGDTDPQRESVVSGATMDVHPISTTRPEAMIRNRDSEQPQKRPRQSQAEQTDLTAMGVAGQDEIGFSLR